MAPEHVETTSPALFERLSQQRSPTGVLAVAKTFDYSLSDLADARRILYLDDINDPGNAGTLLRSAEWFGLDAVCATPSSVDWYNPKLVAAARGSLFRMPHLTLGLAALLSALPEHQLIVADLDGAAARTFEWPSQGVLLIGSESHGPGQDAEQALERPKSSAIRVTIEGSGRATESLNAGVAGSVLMAVWAARQ